MMDPNRLWAKSKWDDEPETPSMFLAGHLEDVYHAAERVLDATADDQLKALGLDPEKYRDRFRGIVLLAAAVHDLGKANDHFQGMIRRVPERRDRPQGLRHEWVTVLMLKSLRDWLLPAVGDDPTDFAILEWAVAGHHPGHDHASPPHLNVAGSGVEIELCMGWKDYQTALAWIKTQFPVADVPGIGNRKRNLVGADDVFAEISNWFRKGQREWDKVKRLGDGRLVAAVKNCLIAADVAGSALPKAVPEAGRWNWITESFGDRPAPGDLQSIVDHRLDGGTPRAFQTAVAESSAVVTFVKAGCGSGKTLAAYMWAAKNSPTRRLFFCYPTTGTATEGFKDYLFPPESDPDTNEKKPLAATIRRLGADLFHSRREVDFEIILKTGRDADNPDADAAIRIDSLDAWSTPIVACTVDTVLGLVQNNKRGLFAWPALAQSAFVFDEIHAFDDRLFGALLRFLCDVRGLPVLLMTASLPKAHEDALRETLAKMGRPFDPIPGPTEWEELPRYRKGPLNDNDPLPLVQETIRAKGKVLWVCNAVGRVMDAASRTACFGPMIYHSRFKYEDRVERHKAVIDAFRGKGSALAICSQVAEMSLDLSADLLVTDRATVPALIQRLGRLNRRAKAGEPTKPFVVIVPDNHLPYTSADLDAAHGWYDRLAGDQISQRQLADAWEHTADQTSDPVASAWLDGGPATCVLELRESSPGITVLMHEDHQRVKARPKELGRLVLPMPPVPRGLNWRAWPKHRGLPVAPAGTINYDRKRGAEWRK